VLNLKKGVAIQGFGPVSYVDGLPREGDKKITAIYNGAYYFLQVKKTNPGF